MKHRRLLGLCLGLALLPTVNLTAASRPNILLVLLDDSGWTDLSCYGSQIDTPRIDQLAAEGMRFTDCHSAAPNCSPSRAGLLTGRTPTRCGVYSYLPDNHVMHLRREEITVAEMLKEKGYRTGHFGKWHLSRLLSDQPGPIEQGFDYSLGTDNNAHPSHHNPVNFIRSQRSNKAPIAAGKIPGYSCQIVVSEALEWIKDSSQSNDDAPFFACVWFHEPHHPIASPPELVSKYQSRYPSLTKKQATYYANIENVDRAVGRLLTGLDDQGLSDDTLIFLTSDNGPLNRFSRAGLRGQKSHVWEGGHRVPGIFRWPGHISPGAVSEVPISGVDFLPTVCSITGIDLPQDRTIDGTSLHALLTGRQKDLERKQPLYWFFYRLDPAIAMRVGPWSLVARSNDSDRPKAHQLVREDMAPVKASRPEAYQLFNLSEDLRQQNDLSASLPEVLNRLRSQLTDLHQDIVREGHHWEIPNDYRKDSKRRLWLSE